MRKVYLDYTASTPVKREVADEMMIYLTENYGNPSSVHSFGFINREALADARAVIAETIGADPSEIYFTSGGTESDNWALRGIAFSNIKKGNHIITSKIEHHAVLNTAKCLEEDGFKLTYLDVDKYGRINPEELKKEIKEDTVLVSIMFDNNEIGTVQDIKTLGEICRERRVLFHTDAVQAYGNVFINVKELPVDLMSLSGHKIYGPKGVGVLYVRKGVKIKKIIYGGSQEKNKRAGTENISGIMGMAKAAEIAHKNLDIHIQKLTELRDYLRDRIMSEIDFVKYNGHPTDRHPGNLNFSFGFIDGESLLIGLDNRGIAGSTGSACSSGSINPSHVLEAIGVPAEMVNGSLRLTVGDFTSKEDLDYTVEKLKEVLKNLRSLSPQYGEYIKEHKDEL